MNRNPKTEPSPSDWVSELLRAENLTPESDLKRIGEAMDGLAIRSQPVAKSRWILVAVIQGACVMVPLLWLVRRWFGLSLEAVAVVVMGSVLLLVASLWWLRWRGMQRTWARARLLAEVVRSALAGAIVPGGLAGVAVLKQVPAVATWLRQRETGSGESHDWPEWKDEWVKARIEDQMGFYHRARERADCQRRRFTRAATLTMDVMLALSVAAVLMTMNPRAGQWIRVLGDYGLEVALGLTGVLLPLGLILVQALRSMLELNRRSGRFTRQVAMLEAAKIDLESTDSENEALEMVRETESQLLAEVVDWYFETEAAESFFSVRERKEKAGASTGGRPSSGRSWLTKWTWIVGGLGFFFLLRVVLGRAPWLLGASGATLCWLAYVTPSDAEMRKELRGNGRLLDTQGEAWAPDALKRDAGCIVIAHGLHDGAILTAAGTESQWMRGMRGALEQRLGSAMPNVAFVDWHLEASPAESLRIAFPTEAGRFAADVVAIRPQGWEVGDYLAFRLAQWIAEGEIRRDRPLHLIGHSAGGFVVSRAALRLLQMNLAPEGMRVTILDTPQPGDEILLELPGQCKVDFYRTSGFVLGLENAAASDQLHLFEPPLEREMNLLEQHSFAHQWFTQTILKANQGDEGFGLSPFCPSRDEVE